MRLPTYWTVETYQGKSWSVGTDTLHRTGPKTEPCVIIPITQITKLTDIEIGEMAKLLVPLAEACGATEIAEKYASLTDQDYYRNAPSDILQTMIYEELPLIESFKGNMHIDPEVFAVASAYLSGLKEQYEARASRKANKTHPERKVVARDYSKLFIQVGRRDGFECGSCGATRDLQIDHVVPISLDGDSALSNLQLLCGSCNASKGATIQDFRITEASTEVQ